MVKYKVLQLLLLVSSITSQALIKGMEAEKTSSMASPKSTISSVALSPDPNIVLIGLSDGTTQVWDPKTGELLKTFTTGEETSEVA